MKDRAAALRYARAIEGAFEGGDEIGQIAGDLAVVAEVMASDPGLATAMTGPGVDAANKLALLDTLVVSARLSPKTALFLKILVEQGRFHLLPEVATLVAKIRDKRQGIVEAEVTTARPLAPDQSELARQTLEKATGRKVRLSLKIDPSMIGGLIAQVGSTVYDGSLRTRLEALRTRLARN